MNNIDIAKKYAYIKDRPIRSIAQGTKKIVVTKEPSKAVLSMYLNKPIRATTLNDNTVLEHIEWYNKISREAMLIFYKQLSSVLLKFGGRDVIFPTYEEDCHNIYKYGQLWYGDKVELVRMALNQCHRNSCDLWYSNKDDFDIKIATGYALTKEGYWIQHSWLVKKRPRSVRVIETTVKMLAYFGYVMTDEQCMEFVNYY